MGDHQLLVDPVGELGAQSLEVIVVVREQLEVLEALVDAGPGQRIAPGHDPCDGDRVDGVGLAAVLTPGFPVAEVGWHLIDVLGGSDQHSSR
jgi:hypothetical protein